MNIHFNGSSEIPSEKDFLGIENKRKGLLGFVQNCATPMTIAVQGNWGIGKTSLMKQLKNDIEPPEADVNSKGVTVWFNTWQFSVLGEQDRLISVRQMRLKSLYCVPMK